MTMTIQELLNRAHAAACAADDIEDLHAIRFFLEAYAELNPHPPDTEVFYRHERRRWELDE